MLQGYLAHKEMYPLDPTVGLGSYGSPRGVGVFLWARYPSRALIRDAGADFENYALARLIQGYLTHKKTPTPLGHS